MLFEKQKRVIIIKKIQKRQHKVKNKRNINQK